MRTAYLIIHTSELVLEKAHSEHTADVSGVISKEDTAESCKYTE